ncbi:MAG: alpha-L-fucosidase [Clostridia bacterium]|nr:alpha-L-fucosidase [Clostridia bacterium]
MWYENSFKRNLIDMHIADWDPAFMSRFDPESYAEAVSASGVDTAIVYAGSCLGICYWPTKAGHMHEGLHGRDIFGETIAACKRRGLKVIGYYNIWNRWEFDHHPEWRMRDRSGKAVQVDYGSRFGLCCPNTGYRGFVERQIRDLCSRYEMDGLWVDMIGWFGTVCFCDGCRKAYKEQTGLDLPEKEDFSNPDWVRFIRRRQKWQSDFAQMINDTARSCQPGLSIAHQSTSFLSGWQGGASMEFLGKSDYLAGDFYLGPAPEAFVCKFLRSAGKHRPIEFMVSRCVGLEEHTTNKSFDLLSMQSMMAVSHLSAFVFIDAIDPEGTINRALYEDMRRLLDRMDPYLPYMRGDARLLADAALYFNPDNLTGGVSADRSFRGEDPAARLSSAYTVTKPLIDANIAFDVITPRDLDRLSDFQVVILPQSVMLDEKETRAFEEYVRGGGRLYVSGACGLLDGDGNPRGDFALAEAMGVRYAGMTDWDMTYMAPTEAGRTDFGNYTEKYPLCMRLPQNVIRAGEDVTVLATRTMPYNPPQERDRFAAAISNPPAGNTGEPALTLHRYGKGCVLYSAGELERIEYSAQREVFANLLRRLLAKDPVWKSNAPKAVQINAFERENGDYLVNVLNFQEQLPAIPVHDLYIALKTDRPIKNAYYAADGKPCRLEKNSGGITLMLRRLDVFEMIVLETA